MSVVSNRVARGSLFSSTGQVGSIRRRELTFYSGTATRPNHFTGNQILGVARRGPGAQLLNGVGPVVTTKIPCAIPAILDVFVPVVIDEVEIQVTYLDPDPTDTYLLFAPGLGVSFTPLSVVVGPGPNQVTLLFPQEELFPAGLYTLKIMRASSPTTCFALRSSVFSVVAEIVCLLEITNMTGDGVFPEFPLSVGGTNFTVQVTGSGFQSGTLVVDVRHVAGIEDPLPVTDVIVADDNTLEIVFDTLMDSDGSYGVVIYLADDESCIASIGFETGEPTIDVSGLPPPPV